jgi:hypothetical protein
MGFTTCVAIADRDLSKTETDMRQQFSVLIMRGLMDSMGD